MYQNIDEKDIFTFLKDEKYGIYHKFDIRMLLNREVENDIFFALKIVNKVLTSQYGIKIKKRGKKNPCYFLSSNDLWESLPHENIKAKDLVDLKTKEIDKTNILNDLDNNIFVDSSDEESDTDIENTKKKLDNLLDSDSESENEFDYIKPNMLKK